MIARSLGSTGPRVSALALGCMGMSDLYGPADEAESIATIHAALDAGVNLLDTGDYYAMGENEMLIRRALQARDRDAAVISVKFGVLRDPAGGWNGVDGRPHAVKNFLAYTLRRLGTDHVDIYRLGRYNPEVPIEETVGAIGETARRLPWRESDRFARPTSGAVGFWLAPMAGGEAVEGEHILFGVGQLGRRAPRAGRLRREALAWARFYGTSARRTRLNVPIGGASVRGTEPLGREEPRPDLLSEARDGSRPDQHVVACGTGGECKRPDQRRRTLARIAGLTF